MTVISTCRCEYTLSKVIDKAGYEFIPMVKDDKEIIHKAHEIFPTIFLFPETLFEEF